MLRVANLSLLAALAIGCRPGRTLEAQAGENSWTTVPSEVLQLRVSKFDGDGTVEVVAPASLESNPPGTVKGPAVKGTRLNVQLEGVPCVVEVLSRYEALVTRSDPPNPNEVRRTTGPGTMTLRGLNIGVSCGDVPVPRTAAATVGHRALPGIAWGLPALVLAVLGGVWLRGTEASGRSMAAIALALIAAVAAGIVPFGGTFTVTYPVLFVGLAIAGITAGHLEDPDEVRSTAAATAGLVIGVVGVAAWHGDWSAGGPVLALLGGVLCAGIGLIAVVLTSD